jgi:predicted dithiol-disulfide oxidoreductase (DUF899 family)
MPQHPVVSREEWIEARKELLLKEKEEVHRRDAINAARLALPWERVEKEYRFDTEKGEKSLADLFEGRSQLIVYHFMLGPGWDAGCPGCSFVADHFEGALPHLTHHDVTLTAVSRAPLDAIAAYKKRMGWRFPWASSNSSDFNFDYGVSFTKEQLASGSVPYNYVDTPTADANDELPGLSAFIKDEDGTIYHTYSTYARGLEPLVGTLMILDRAPLGRNERTTMDFVKRHDEYEAADAKSCCHADA